MELNGQVVTSVLLPGEALAEEIADRLSTLFTMTPEVRVSLNSWWNVFNGDDDDKWWELPFQEGSCSRRIFHTLSEVGRLEESLVVVVEERRGGRGVGVVEEGFKLDLVSSSIRVDVHKYIYMNIYINMDIYVCKVNAVNNSSVASFYDPRNVASCLLRLFSSVVGFKRIAKSCASPPISANLQLITYPRSPAGRPAGPA